MPQLYTASYDERPSSELDPQLVDAPSRAPRIIGYSLMALGGAALVVDVAMYAAETGYR